MHSIVKINDICCIFAAPFLINFIGNVVNKLIKIKYKKNNVQNKVGTNLIFGQCAMERGKGEKMTHCFQILICLCKMTDFTDLYLKIEQLSMKRVSISLLFWKKVKISWQVSSQLAIITNQLRQSNHETFRYLSGILWDFRTRRMKFDNYFSVCYVGKG